MDAFYAQPPPEEPPSRLVAGYVITNISAIRLTLKLKHLDPDNPRHATYFSPPPGPHISGNFTLIEKSIREYMVASGLGPSVAGVEVTFT